MFSEKNFQRAAGIFKLSESDLSARVGGFGSVWGKCESKGAEINMILNQTTL